MLLFLIVCMAIAVAGGGSGDDPTHQPFLLLGCGTNFSSPSTSASEHRRPCCRLVRWDLAELGQLIDTKFFTLCVIYLKLMFYNYMFK